VATGGWATAIAAECPRIGRVDPLLTLTGLRLIAERYG
jgi:pantothenate kinase type III